MDDLFLRYSGVKDGHVWFRTTNTSDASRLADKFAVGATIRAKMTLPRSEKEHNLFFVWLDKVYDNLPETAPEFRSVTHFRHWLTYRAGHCKATMIPKDSVKDGVLAAILSLHDDHFFEEHSNAIWIYRAKSISKEEKGMVGDGFHKFFQRCQDIVSAELLPGVTLEELMGSLQDAA